MKSKMTADLKLVPNKTLAQTSLKSFVDFYSQFPLYILKEHLPYYYSDDEDDYHEQELNKLVYLKQKYEIIKRKEGAVTFTSVRKDWIKSFQDKITDKHHSENTPDWSPFLFHFVKSSETLNEIIESRELIGGTGWIRKPHRAVCFTETPLRLNQFHKDFIPYGIVVEKDFIVEKGGGAVITQVDYDELSFKLQPRFKAYSTGKDNHGWEREWRISGDIKIRQQTASVIVPTRKAAKRIKTDYGWMNTISFEELGVEIIYSKDEEKWLVTK